ncbi:18571_t:CDS:1, partial [Dentiscutata erythropus]
IKFFIINPHPNEANNNAVIIKLVSSLWKNLGGEFYNWWDHTNLTRIRFD